MIKYLNDLYRRRDLIFYLVASGLKALHRNTALGYLWWLLDPLLNTVIYYFVVVIVFNRGGDGYGAYLIVGLIVWRWLSASVSAASQAIVSQAGIISQVYLPKIVFPITVTVTGVINFIFGLAVIAVFFLAWGMVPGLAVLWLPLVMLAQLLFTLALTSVLAYICVFLRDTDTMVSHLMRLWFFGSPVIWLEDMIPPRVQWLVSLNPMAHLLTAYRDVLITRTTPDAGALLAISSASLGVSLFMVYFYSQNEHRIIKAL